MNLNLILGNLCMNQTDFSQQKILVVDDNTHYLRLIERILQINCYQNIMTLTDPQNVVDTYKSLKPDLLLIDIQTSSINGLDILNELRKERRDERLPVILFTEQKNADQMVKALELGIQDVIARPFSQKDVLLSISSFFEANRCAAQASYKAFHNFHE